MNDGRALHGFAMNVDRLVPWRTLTGRQHLYLDHELYIEFGEQLPTFKLKPGPFMLNELENSQKDERRHTPAELPDAARQVAHPHHLHGQPADAHP